MWDILVSWRLEVFDTISGIVQGSCRNSCKGSVLNASNNKNRNVRSLKQVEDVKCAVKALATLNDTGWSLHRLAKAARKQRLNDLCLRTLERLPKERGFHVEETISHLRERALICVQETNPCMKRNGLTLLNHVNLNLCSAAIKADLFRIKAQLLDSLGQWESSQKLFFTSGLLHLASKGSNVASHTWLNWARSVDRLWLRLPEAKTMDKKLSECALSGYLQAVANGSESGQMFMSRIFAAIHGKEPSNELSATLKKHVFVIPVRVWLPWIPQLFAGLDRPEFTLYSVIIARIADMYPQSVIFPLLDKVFELQNSCNADASDKTKMRLKRLNEILYFIKAKHWPVSAEANLLRSELISIAKGIAGHTLVRSTVCSLLEQCESILHIQDTKGNKNANGDAHVARMEASLLGCLASECDKMLSGSGWNQDNFWRAVKGPFTRCFHPSVVPRLDDSAVDLEGLIRLLLNWLNWLDDFEERHHSFATKNLLSGFSSTLAGARFDALEIPGQYSAKAFSSTHPGNNVRLWKFARRATCEKGVLILGVLGDDGRECVLTLERSHSKHAASQGRMDQCKALLNTILMRYMPSRRESLCFEIAPSVCLGGELILTMPGKRTTSLQDLYKSYMFKRGKDPNVALRDLRGANLKDIILQYGFLLSREERFVSICKTLVPEHALSESIMECYGGKLPNYFAARAKITAQYALESALAFGFSRGGFLPKNAHIQFEKGTFLLLRMKPEYAKGGLLDINSKFPPFRLPPALTHYISPNGQLVRFKDCIALASASICEENKHAHIMKAFLMTMFLDEGAALSDEDIRWQNERKTTRFNVARQNMEVFWERIKGLTPAYNDAHLNGGSTGRIDRFLSKCVEESMDSKHLHVQRASWLPWW